MRIQNMYPTVETVGYIKNFANLNYVQSILKKNFANFAVKNLRGNKTSQLIYFIKFPVSVISSCISSSAS
jgi:hypothetical protein